GIDAQIEIVRRILENRAERRRDAVDLLEVVVREDGDLHSAPSPDVRADRRFRDVARPLQSRDILSCNTMRRARHSDTYGLRRPSKKRGGRVSDDETGVPPSE